MGRMDVIRPILALVHVGSALVYVTGYASTKMLSQIAISESDPGRRRVIFGIGDKIDSRFQALGGTIAGLSGLMLAVANGYALTQVWILLSIVIFAVVVVIGAGFWRHRSIAVRAALDAGDDARVVWLLTEPRARLVGWLELALIVTIVALMVLRPA
jgi:uncharacterized membrane protein